MQIHIPFKERFREPMLNGVKILTSRTKRYGQVGDWFNAFGQTFVLTSVEKRGLYWIVDHWQYEGCSSEKDFLEVWQSIHPVKALDMNEQFWVHQFRNISKKI